jgi:hypothetical protein
MAKVSVVIPIHDMPNGAFFIWRAIQSVMKQTFTDYEIVITKAGKMAENTNAGIKKAKGEIIKILYMDDYLAHENSLLNIVDAFDEKTQWLVTGCLHQAGDEVPHSPHYPEYTADISTGNNKIGSPSVLSLRRETALLFDESLSWVLDCDLYQRYYKLYGEPTILNDLNVVIGLGEHQTTYALTNEQKSAEHNYLMNKTI